ncbi:hypothetical protein [Vibrio neonatus]|uniref:hypothetical protein n=1 Tax=Vibrio neonatus TaxID=278860 RepID=UPI0021C45A8D|nr:hypothetical protein [Vibrio neonatus]
MEQNITATPVASDNTVTVESSQVQETLKQVRHHLYQVMAPNWKSGYVTEKVMYQLISNRLGYEFSIENVASVEEGRAAYRWAQYFNKMFEDERQIMSNW